MRLFLSIGLIVCTAIMISLDGRVFRIFQIILNPVDVFLLRPNTKYDEQTADDSLSNIGYISAKKWANFGPVSSRHCIMTSVSFFLDRFMRPGTTGLQHFHQIDSISNKNLIIICVYFSFTKFHSQTTVHTIKDIYLHIHVVFFFA